MKKISSAVLGVLMLALSIIILSQSKPITIPDDWKVIAKDDAGYTYAVNMTRIEADGKGPVVKFVGLAYHDKDNFELTSFSGNCDSGEMAILATAGKEKGKEFMRKAENPKPIHPDKDTAATFALKTVCTSALGDMI